MALFAAGWAVAALYVRLYEEAERMRLAYSASATPTRGLQMVEG